MCKSQKRTGDDESTLTLKPTATFIRSPKQGYQWPHKMNVDITFFKENLMLFYITCRGIRNVPHVSVARHNPTEGYPTIFPAMRDMWVPLFRCLYQVRFPSRHWETCGYQGKDCVAMEVLHICDCHRHSGHHKNFRCFGHITLF